MSAQKMLRTEFARYVVGRTIAAVGQASGKDVRYALAHMHTARIFITLADLKERCLVQSITDVPALECISKGSMLLSSSLCILSGNASIFRAAEALSLYLRAAVSIRAFWRIRKAMKIQKKSLRSSSLRKMYIKALSSSVLNVLEGISISFGGRFYFAVSLLKASIFIWYYYGDSISK